MATDRTQLDSAAKAALLSLVLSSRLTPRWLIWDPRALAFGQAPFPFGLSSGVRQDVGEVGRDRRRLRSERQLQAHHRTMNTRLGLLARQGEVSVHTAQYAVCWLKKQFAFRRAAEMGEAAIACIEQAEHAVPLGLRGETAENDQLVGEVQLALAHLDRALREI